LYKPRSVLVVGGGLAGWITATYLHAALNRGGRRLCDVSLVDVQGACPERGAEASLPELNRYLAMLGIDQRRFMQQVGCTFSQGTRFAGWLTGTGEDYFHPFSFERPGSVDRAAEHWLRSNRSIAFADTVSVQPALCRQELAPLMLGPWDFGAPLAYGFHVDRARFRDFLKMLGSAGAIRQSAEPAVRAEVADDGHIGSVVTAGERRLTADLYVDCSDESGLLIEALGIPWVDRSGLLPCDRVVSTNVPYEARYPGYVHPYTTATALQTGWLQEIPLLDGRSLRQFYASDLLSDDEAAGLLSGAAGARGGLVDGAAEPLRTAHRERAWVGNCIAIGAPAAAIEPLESTSLYLVHHAAAMLAEHFPLGSSLEPLSFRYNRTVVNRFYELLDFANLHYCLSQRDDSEFWRRTRQPSRITERLAAKLDFWRQKRPTPADFEDQRLPGQREPERVPPSTSTDPREPVDTAGLWDHENYEAVLYGMNFLSRECDQWYGQERPDTVVPRHIASRVARAPAKLPPHTTWLQQVLGMPSYPSR